MARSLRQTLLDDLPEGKEIALTYACAAAGMDGFAAQLAGAFASVAFDLSKWVREHGPSATPSSQTATPSGLSSRLSFGCVRLIR